MVEFGNGKQNKIFFIGKAENLRNRMCKTSEMAIIVMAVLQFAPLPRFYKSASLLKKALFLPLYFTAHAFPATYHIVHWPFVTARAHGYRFGAAGICKCAQWLL